MPCFYPLQAVRTAEGIKIGGARPGERKFATEGDWLDLPCGTCVGCQLSRAREWAFRGAMELVFHDVASFVTLTYDDAHLPPTLRKRDAQLFMKRLRRALPSRRVRFLLSGEYGETTLRPHYHAILYSVGPDDYRKVEGAWSDDRGAIGFCDVKPVNPARIAYVAGYVTKKVGVEQVQEERVVYSTGEVYQFQPEFRLMSRKPGLGGDARKHWRSWRDHAVIDGRKFAVPRYLHEAYLKNASLREVFLLAVEKRRNRKPLDWDRLRDGAVVAAARLKAQNERRKL